MEVVIETRELSKDYMRDENPVTALKGVDLRMTRGEFLALMGPSGSGKSTLLHLIAAMDRPSSGEVLVLGQDLRALGKRELARWRNRHIGFIFQAFNLIPVLTALENVMLPLKLTGLSANMQRRRWNWWGSATDCITSRANCPEDRNSASRLRGQL